MERANIAEDRKAVLKEAQGRGYEAKPISMIVAEQLFYSLSCEHIIPFH